jgi:hypothetical protein
MQRYFSGFWNQTLWELHGMPGVSMFMGKKYWTMID